MKRSAIDDLGAALKMAWAFLWPILILLVGPFIILMAIATGQG